MPKNLYTFMYFDSNNDGEDPLRPDYVMFYQFPSSRWPSRFIFEMQSVGNEILNIYLSFIYCQFLSH